MRIQHNIPALNTYRQLGINNTGAAKALEKLSSGYRINRAGDDAAGLAISEKMRAQIRGLDRASGNAQDGISLIQSAEGALQESQNILQRMRYLAVQAGNDTNTTQDRAYIQDEMNQLTKELDRIAFTTEFNKKTLLDGSLQHGAKTARTVTGFGVSTGLVASSTLTPGMYNIETTTVGVKSKQTLTITMGTSVAGETVNVNMTNNIAIGSNVLLNAGNIAVFTASGDIDKDTATLTNILKDIFDQSFGEFFEVTSSGNTLTITALKAETGTYDSMGALAFTTSSVKPDNSTGTSSASLSAGTHVIGRDAVISVNGNTATAGSKYQEYVYTSSSGDKLTFNMDDVTRSSAAVIQVIAGRELTLQVGANSQVDQTVRIGVGATSSAALGVDSLRVHNNEAARASLASIDKALNSVSDQRAALGAVQNRLEHTILNLDTISENLQDAESRIRDVDMAKEMMNFTKFSILMQSSQAMLAQANGLPQGVLQLLR